MNMDWLNLPIVEMGFALGGLIGIAGGFWAGYSVENIASYQKGYKHGREKGKTEADNAKLREQYETVFADYRSEVANLRELVLTLAFCANDEADCDQCPMNGARCDVVQQCFCDGTAEALRELGVEVDG